MLRFLLTSLSYMNLVLLWEFGKIKSVVGVLNSSSPMRCCQLNKIPCHDKTPSTLTFLYFKKDFNYNFSSLTMNTFKQYTVVLFVSCQLRGLMNEITTTNLILEEQNM